MTFVGLHAVARRNRRRLVLLGVMLFVAGAVVVAHSAAADSHMGDGTPMCLAVMSIGAAALVGLARVAAQKLRLPVLAPLAPRQCVPLMPLAVLPQTRAGPAFLQVFLG